MASTTTTNLGLWKPTPGTKEPWSTSQLNSNYDKLDAAIGARLTKITTTTIQNTTTEGNLWGANISGAIQGSIWKLVAFGTFDAANIAVTGTLTWRVKIGLTTMTTYTITLPNTTAQSNQPWQIEADIECMTTGAAGTWRNRMFGAVSNNNVDGLVNRVPSGTTTKDTTVAQLFEVTGTWSVANAGHILRCDAGYLYRVTNA
jgi:hypothetical protein